MPHTDAIPFAVTLGLLLIIFRIVSVVTEGVSVVVSVVSAEVSVVVFVVSTGVSVVLLIFPSSFRQVSILSGLLFSSTVGMLQPLSRIQQASAKFRNAFVKVPLCC